MPRIPKNIELRPLAQIKGNDKLFIQRSEKNRAWLVVYVSQTPYGYANVADFLDHMEDLPAMVVNLQWQAQQELERQKGITVHH